MTAIEIIEATLAELRALTRDAVFGVPARRPDPEVVARLAELLEALRRAQEAE